jgi:endoglucanase
MPSLQLRGVNRAGAEFGDDWDGWTGQTYYEWPPVTVRASELNDYASKGMNVVRLPISWERLQHTLGSPLDPTYQANLVDYVEAATAMGFTVRPLD